MISRRRRRPVRHHHLAKAAPSVALAKSADPRILQELASPEVGNFELRGEVKPKSEILLTRSLPGQGLGDLWPYMLDKDPYSAGMWGKRWKAYLGLPRYILPRDETREAKKTAEFCRLALAEVPRLHTNLEHQMGAMTDAWAAEEIMWQPRTSGPISGKWGLDLIDRPQRRFLYKRNQTGVPELHVRRRNGKHVKAPDGKFLIAKTGSKENPWGGLGLLHKLYWTWYAGEHAWKYYALLLEKWCMPTAVGKYEPGKDKVLNQQKADQLRGLLEQIQTDYSIAIPKGLEIGLIEAARGGEVSFTAFLQMVNLGKALVFLGEGDTSGIESGQGSHARRRVSNEVRLETLRIDAHEMDAHYTDQLLKLLVWVNFGPSAPVPYWWTEIQDMENLAMRQERADSLLSKGLPLPLEDFYRLNRQRMPREGESVIRLQSSEGAIEVIDPPPGFPGHERIRRADAAALMFRGDLHQYQLTAGSI